jgi:hypothetical protein
MDILTEQVQSGQITAEDKMRLSVQSKEKYGIKQCKKLK